MATLIDSDRVKYLCSCSRMKSLCEMYYCKYCRPSELTLKCKECVIHEIDPKYFCPNCFDNKTHADAISQRYRCANCYSCPCCDNILIVRASSQKIPKDNSNSNSTPLDSQQPTSQKVFYLLCGFCRWSTRDSGIPDATTSLFFFQFNSY
jgi:dynactin 4